MATITIDFIGICTHFPYAYIREVPHRVVCADGRAVNGIRPHFVTLSVYAHTNDEVPAITLPLKRQRVRVFTRDSEYQGTTRYDPNVDLIFRIGRYTTPANEVIVSGRGAAAFFDLRGGTFRHLCLEGGARACRVTIDDIDEPSLEITSFEDLLSRTSIPLANGALVELRHTEWPLEKGPDHSHFRLHYLVSGRMPDGTEWIPEDKDACKRGERRDSLNVGCSNSMFP